MYSKFMNIKNAIGHGNIRWVGDDLVLENIWNPSDSDIKPIHRKITCNRNELLSFFLQSDLYLFSLGTQYENNIPINRLVA